MKKLDKRFFGYLAYTVCTVLLAGLFFYISITKSDVSLEIKKINAFFEENIAILQNKDKITPLSINDLDEVSDVFHIEFRDSSSIFYWNQETNLTQGFFHVSDTIHRDGKEIIYYLPLYETKSKKLNTEISSYLEIYNDYFFSEGKSSSIKLKIGDSVFSFFKKNLYPRDFNYTLYIGLLILSFFFFAIVFGWQITSLTEWILFSITFIFLRAILYHLSVYQDWSYNDVFKVTNEVSHINKSIGDYWINLLLLSILTLSLRKIKILHPSNPRLGAVIEVVNGFFIGGLFLYYSLSLRGFILNENINLNVEKVLSLDLSNIIILLGLVFGHVLIFTVAVYTISWTKKLNYTLPLIFISGIGIMISASIANFWISYHPLILAGYTLSFVAMIDLYLDNKSKNLIWLIWWGTVLSAFTGCLIYYESLQKDINTRKKEISSMYVPVNKEMKSSISEIDSLLVISEFSDYIANLPFPNIVYQEDIKSFSNSVIKEVLPDEFVLDNVLIFDKYRTSLFQASAIQFYDIDQKISLSHRIGKNQFYNPFTQTYFLLYDIETNYYPTGPFTVIFSIRNPEIEPSKLSADLIISKNDDIIIPSIQTIDEGLLAKLKTGPNEFYYNGYSVIEQRFPDGFKVISTKRIASILKPMTLFSYVFTILGVLVLLIALLNSRFQFLYYPLNIHLLQKRSLRNTIQVGLIALIIFSFIAIGLLTAVYFKNILEENSIENEKTIVYELIKKLNSDIQSANNKEMALINIQNKLRTVDELINAEIELYDENGAIINLMNESDDKRIPYNIYYNTQQSISTISTEKETTPNIQFIPLYHESDKPFAYLSVDDENERKFSENILDFLSTLLNVYVFLFLLAVAIAVLISNSITKPLATLADKLRAFKLGKRNEPLEWNKEDEIGTLIKDYNNLIHQLDESARIIAKTERDTAWREMAKQVAHEIKNPLTPMKLSIQYLERSLKESNGDNKAMITRVSNTLLEQINNLSEIANEFSNFAKMPQSNNEKIVLNEIVEAVHDLFRKRDDMDIQMTEPLRDLVVFADRGQLVRILNNLVKNAVQAIPADRRGLIIISLYEEGDKAVIKVRDNGVGIPENMKNKVFTPNFTTKSSGTGLGLAISANIIDGFNGKIYFETEVEKGTDFFVEIPLMRIEEQILSGEKRVILE